MKTAEQIKEQIHKLEVKIGEVDKAIDHTFQFGGPGRQDVLWHKRTILEEHLHILHWVLQSDNLKPEQFGVGSLDCQDGTRLDVHMANNAGRGANKVTLTRVKNTVTRPKYTRDYAAADVIAQTRTAGWRGQWTLNAKVRKELGME